MKANTREWIKKAEADFTSAKREARARKNPNYDAACFFCQQCMEKYLKARLVEADIPFPKTHDLEVLLDLVVSEQPFWESLRPQLAELTGYATAFRYPGESATRSICTAAVRNAVLLRKQIRADMRLPLNE